MKKNKRSLSIAHIHWGFPPIIGGVETHLTIIMPEMVEMGHKVSLFTSTVEGTSMHENYQGVDVVRTPLLDLNWLYRRGLTGLREEIVDTFKKFLDRTKPDVIHAHNMNYFSAVHVRSLEELAKKRGIPLILTAHNAWDDNVFLDLTRNVSWSQIIAVSHFIKRELMGIGIDHRKITVTHHGVDHHVYNPQGSIRRVMTKYPKFKGRRILFHPARMGLAKGCDISIKALNVIKEYVPDVMLVLAGTKNVIDWGATQQKDIAYMVDLVDFFKLRNHILIDSYPLDLMPELYRVSEVCLYPSTAAEPFGLTMLEALATERPMVVTQTGGMPEIIRDGVNGFVIPVRDYETLAARVISLLNNTSLRERLGCTGREMVQQQYTKKAITRATIEVYRNALKMSARARIEKPQAPVKEIPPAVTK